MKMKPSKKPPVCRGVYAPPPARGPPRKPPPQPACPEPSEAERMFAARGPGRAAVLAGLGKMAAAVAGPRGRGFAAGEEADSGNGRGSGRGLGPSQLGRASEASPGPAVGPRPAPAAAPLCPIRARRWARPSVPPLWSLLRGLEPLGGGSGSYSPGLAAAALSRGRGGSGAPRGPGFARSCPPALCPLCAAAFGFSGSVCLARGVPAAARSFPGPTERTLPAECLWDARVLGGGTTGLSWMSSGVRWAVGLSVSV